MERAISMSGWWNDLMDEQVPIFIAEIAPKNLRGGLTTINQVEDQFFNSWSMDQ